MDLFTDDNNVQWRVHKAAVCKGSNCAIHNPSDHPLKNARITLRHWSPLSFKPHGFAERICEHGYGHSDPDSVAFYDSIGERGHDVHGCDGCCRRGMNIEFDAEDWKPEHGEVMDNPITLEEIEEFVRYLDSMPCAEES